MTSPGSVGRIWNVRDGAGANHEPKAIDRLHREILAHYDVDQSPERFERTDWPTPDVIERTDWPTPDVIELEGAAT